jgi:hypothetical protein
MSENAFELPIVGLTPRSSLLTQKITGLNPPDRSLFIGDYSQDGGIYQGNRVGNRNVVFLINLNPNPALGETVPGLREMLYKAFMNPQAEGDYIKLLMHFDNFADRYLVGYTEKFEAEVFDSETLCQISLICPDPYIRDDASVVLTNPTGWIQVPFTYSGTAKSGFEIRAYITAAITDFTLANNSKPMYFHNPAGYAVGDIIIVNTNRGYRAATLTRATALTGTPFDYAYNRTYLPNNCVFYNNGIWKCLATVVVGAASTGYVPNTDDGYWAYLSTSMVPQLSPESDWLELHAQANSLRVYGGTTVSSIIGNIKMLRYDTAYWGI